MADPAPSPSTDTDRLKREYWCFISYRHADNKEPGRQWATWLHQTLETYEVPADLVGTKNQRGDVIPERIFPVFRDEEELPADASLSTPIEAALQNSRFLVVLCSPNAVRSSFVADEILRFKQLGKQDRILAAILYGEPTMATNMERECFPKPLRHAIDESGQLIEKLAEPIAADFRLHDGGQGWTSPAAYRDVLKAAGMPDKAANEQVNVYMRQQNLMLLKIVAGVLGVPLGVLTARDKAYQIEKQKQRAKVLRRWLTAVSGLAVAALIAGVLAVRNANEAEAQRDQVAKKSHELSDTLGVAYFREGSARLKDPRTACEGLAYLARAVREHGHATAANRLLTFLQQRDVWVCEDAGAAPAPAPVKEEEKPVVPAFVKPPVIADNKEPGKFDRVVKGPNGLVAVSWCEDVDSTEGSNHPGSGLHHFRVWDADGKPLCDWIHANAEADAWVGNINGMTFSPDGTWLAVTVERWRQPAYLQIWDFRRGAQVGDTMDATGKDPHYQSADFTKLVFMPEKQDAEKRSCALLIGSSRGDASWVVIHRPQDAAESYLQDVAVVSHHSAIRAMLLLQDAQETFVTASDDAEVWFTPKPGDLEVSPVPVLKMEQPVDALRADTTGGVLLQVGARQHRALKIPAQSLAGKPQAQSRLWVYTSEDREIQVDRKNEGDPETIFKGTVDEAIVKAHAQEDPAGLSIEGAGGAVTAFLLQDGKAHMVADGRGSEIVIDPEKGAHKQTLRGLVADMRLTAGGSALVALTRQYEYQVFDVATGALLSRPLVESVFFTDDQAASELEAAMLSPDRSVLLTRSLHHEPPNVDLTWTMLWDCASGEPLTDRMLYTDIGMEKPQMPRDPYLNNDTANIEGMVLFRAKPALYPILSELGESLAGLQLDATGELRAVKQSSARVKELLQKLVEMSR
ncbi:toll/interleukin-1 receptor domain-containing protein [Prosthecobacter sp.]|uniref:toll/interleukin-1 receptor domain-containing protein n=1 Tax=Prosthecobacter sp. TaxID=1965333 RepID=UPI003783ACBB